jgi:uncharacterized RDD family membrane protein YckC
MMEENAALRSWESCPACGFSNALDETRCGKCGRRLGSPQLSTIEKPGSAADQSPNLPASQIGPALIHAVANPRQAAGRLERGDYTDTSLPSPRLVTPLPESVRKQLSRRVQTFRSRRLDGSLPFQFDEGEDPAIHEEEPRAASIPVVVHTKAVPVSTLSPSCSNLQDLSSLTNLPLPAAESVATPRQYRKTQPQIAQPELSFPSPASQEENFLTLPVAPFRLRLFGHGVDFALTVAAFLLFLAPYRLIVGSFAPSRLLLVGIGSAYLLLVLLYGILFLFLAGATPSMKWVGLRVVNFDGVAPNRRQLLYRLLGSIASVGSFFVGFLWAAVDEEKLSWHDRISKTFLTVSNQ